MKKKTLLYSLLIAMGSLTATSCSDDFLKDMAPYDKYSPEKVFGNENNLDLYIQNIYYNYFRVSGFVPTQSYSLVGKYTNFTEYTEEQTGISTYFDSSENLNKATDCNDYFGTNLSTTVQNNPYSRIRSCNDVLEGIEKYGQNLSEDAKKKAKGQAYFLRALQLFDLVRVYGGVPIVNKVLDASDREGAKAYKRQSVEACITQILSDLENAAQLLPTRKEWGGDQYGRLTKEAAYAYKSRVALVFASPIFNTDWNNTDNQRWKDALQITQNAKTFLDEEGYGLYGSSAKDWDAMFHEFDNTWVKEAIMVKMLASTAIKDDEHSNWQKSIRPKTMGGSGSGTTVPMGMLDIFPMADGKPAINDNGEAINGYDKFLFFKNRDPRFYYTFTFSGMKWGYDKDENAVLWNYRWVKTDGTGDNPETGRPNYISSYTPDDIGGSSPAILRKMSDPNENSENTYQYDGTDVLEYRYAELLLNLAECYAATGDADNAVKIIGQIRERVGISKGSDNWGLGNITDKNEAIKAVLRERQIELAYEGKRYWDLWRWMLFNDDANDNNNTCATLGIKQLNGTFRYTQLLQIKDYDLFDHPEADPTQDPLDASERDQYIVDLDNTADLQADLEKLGQYWTKYFMLEDPDIPADCDSNNKQAYISWRQNYYLSGLKDNVLKMNPWLEQSKGWLDAYEVQGTFDARK